MKYILTEEGKKYAKEGTPEIKLAELLKKGPIPMDKARENTDNFSVALQWLKKHDAVEMKEELLRLKQFPKILEDTVHALKDVEKGKSVPAYFASMFLQRKLMTEQKETMKRRAERMTGKEISNLTEELIKTGMWKQVKFRPYNVTVRGRKLHIGKRHPYQRFLLSVRRKLVEMGFAEMRGPLVETEFWNFDALFQPQNHPSRDWAQTYSLKRPKTGWLPDEKFVEYVKLSHENGWKTGGTGWQYVWDESKAKRLMPRAHTTSLSARTLAAGPSIPGKYFAIGRCYRPDVIDATHGVEFNQTEGIVIEEDLTLKSLLGILKQFAAEFAGAEKIKFLPDYYPFTEPSVQMSAKHPDLGWIELGGAGIFREELTKPLGVEVPVIAWGLGIDRLAMYKLGITDIRELFSRNLEWLRNVAI